MTVKSDELPEGSKLVGNKISQEHNIDRYIPAPVLISFTIHCLDLHFLPLGVDHGAEPSFWGQCCSC